MPNTLGQGLNKFEKNDSIRQLGLHMKCRGFYRLQAGNNVREGKGFAAFTVTTLLHRRASSRSLSGNTRFAHICSCSFARDFCILVVFYEPVNIRRCSHVTSPTKSSQCAPFDLPPYGSFCSWELFLRFLPKLFCEIGIKLMAGIEGNGI
jgi:hypothetical protein